jgi:serine/threonine protein kinase
MASLKTGTIVDRYVIEGLLGQGGMAVVYRVRHKDLDSVHALKVLTVHSESIRERLRQEGKAQARLRHANIVSVTDLVDVHGAPGLIMECVDGPDLCQLMPLIKGDLKLVDTLARGIMSGVLEAHRLGMVHRDLKPANILVAKQGERPVPKVTDFGLVKVLIAEGDGTDRTQAGSTMGTPAYMAPEQIRDPRLVDARADLFSLGVILYELCCGTKPFTGNDMLELFTAITSGKFRPPRELNPQIPERMERAILGALEVQREQRIPDCRVLFEVWEGRLVDWRAISLDKVGKGEHDPRWEDVIGSAWSEGAELSNSMTAVPSSLEPAARTAPKLGSDGGAETYYDDAPPDAEPPVVPEDIGGGDETFYHPPPRDDDALPPRAVVPDAAPAGTPDKAPARPRALPWIAGLAALAALAVGGTLLLQDPPSPLQTLPTTAAAPAEPAPAVADVPEPAPEPEPVEDPPAPGPATTATPTTAQPAPSVVAPAPASPTPALAPTQPEPAVADAPEPSPSEPAAVSTTATVSVEGGIRVWLVGPAGRFPAGEIPPGSYTIKAFFDPMSPLDAGSLEAVAGDSYAVKCSTAMQRCTAAPL